MERLPRCGEQSMKPAKKVYQALDGTVFETEYLAEGRNIEIQLKDWLVAHFSEDKSLHFELQSKIASAMARERKKILDIFESEND